MPNSTPGATGTMLSVIVIAHNEEQHIHECLDSIVQQHCEDFELIVVDDYSSDGTLDILAGYAKRYSNIHLICNGQSLGAGPSRNAGIEQINGQYLMFVDGDDFLVDDSLVKITQQLAEESPDILVFNHNLVYDDGLVLVARQADILNNASQLKGDAQKQYLLKLYQIACNKVYSAAFVKQQALYFKSGNYEDTAYAYKSLLLGQSISVSTRSYYNYRQRPGTAPYRPNKKESRVNQRFLVERYEEIFEYTEQQNLCQFTEVIYSKMLVQFNAVIGERYDSKDKVLFEKMRAVLIQYQPEKIQWPTFRSRIAYWCIRFGMVRALIFVNRLYSCYRRYQK